MSSPTWQDRRFMGMVAKPIHEGSRRYSGSQPSPPAVTAPAAPAAPAADEPEAVTKKVLSGGGAWEGDRRFLGMQAKPIHEPPRRMSGSETTKPVVVPKSTSPPAPTSTTTSGPGGIASAIAGRRRSSASSQGGIFSGLLANRSNDVHEQRRQSYEEMKAPGGFGGFFSALVNKPAEKK